MTCPSVCDGVLRSWRCVTAATRRMIAVLWQWSAVACAMMAVRACLAVRGDPCSGRVATPRAAGLPVFFVVSVCVFGLPAVPFWTHRPVCCA